MKLILTIIATAILIGAVILSGCNNPLPASPQDSGQKPSSESKPAPTAEPVRAVTPEPTPTPVTTSKPLSPSKDAEETTATPPPPLETVPTAVDNAGPPISVKQVNYGLQHLFEVFKQERSRYPVTMQNETYRHKFMFHLNNKYQLQDLCDAYYYDESYSSISDALQFLDRNLDSNVSNSELLGTTRHYLETTVNLLRQQIELSESNQWRVLECISQFDAAEIDHQKLVLSVDDHYYEYRRGLSAVIKEASAILDSLNYYTTLEPTSVKPLQIDLTSDKIAYSSRRDGNWEIYLMDPDGEHNVNLTNHAAADISPAWSPDGNRIAFTSTRNGNYEIYVMNIDGTNVTRLTNDLHADMDPAWSPDGTQITFTSWRYGSAEICIMNSNGSMVSRVTDNEFYDGNPDWSPDGKQIAFQSDRDGNHDLYVMNPNGRRIQQITDSPMYDGDPRWSPDGTMIAYTSGGANVQAIISAQAPGIFTLPSWVGGGTYFFPGRPGGGGPTDNTLSDLSAVGTATWDYLFPTLFNDGTHLVITFAQERYAPRYTNDIYTVSVVYMDGFDMSDIIGAQEGDLPLYYAPAWSPDGKAMAVIAEKTRLVGNIGTTICILPDISNRYSRVSTYWETSVTPYETLDVEPAWKPSANATVKISTVPSSPSDSLPTNSQTDTGDIELRESYQPAITIRNDEATQTPTLSTTAYRLQLISNDFHNFTTKYALTEENGYYQHESLYTKGDSGTTVNWCDAYYIYEAQRLIGNAFEVTDRTNLIDVGRDEIIGNVAYYLETTVSYLEHQEEVVETNYWHFVKSLKESNDTDIIPPDLLEEADDRYFEYTSGLSNLIQEITELRDSFTFSASYKPIKPVTPSIASSNDKITFATRRDGNWEIYLMDTNGDNQINLTRYPSADISPVWSPDGTKIAFASNRDGNYEIYTMNLNGSYPVRLTYNRYADLDPCWSPDGKQIAFTSWRFQNAEICIMDADGSNVSQVTTDDAADEKPAWSPDGKLLAFQSDRDGDFDVYVIDINHGNVQNLTNNDVFDGEPDWSPDGTRIAFTQSVMTYQIYTFNYYSEVTLIMNSDGSGSYRIGQTPDGISLRYFAHAPSWSPDGNQIVHLIIPSSAHRWAGTKIELVPNVINNSTKVVNITGTNYEDADPDWGPSN